MNGVVDVYLSAGSNIEPERHLRMACRELEARYGALRLSPVYRTAAVGFDGDPFLNLVVAFRTDEPPGVVVDYLESLHRKAGRVRGPDAFASRTLDLDLLLYGDRVDPDPAIRVPRADILRYAFVLRPLCDLAPELRHPVDGRTMAELWAGFDRADPSMERVDVALG